MLGGLASAVFPVGGQVYELTAVIALCVESPRLSRSCSIRRRLSPLIATACLVTTVALAASTWSQEASADTFNVNDQASYANALRDIALDPGDDHTINVTGSFTMSDDVAPVVLDDGSTLTVNGNGFTVDGAGSFRPFFVSSSSPTTAGGPTVNISNLTIANGAGTGGTGSGGGMGAGGGLFVDQNTTVVLDLVNFSNNSATGGAGTSGGRGGGGLGGDSGLDPVSGGGGLYGTGGNSGDNEGGGGGGGALGAGGDGSINGSGGGGGGFFGDGGNAGTDGGGGGGGGFLGNGGNGGDDGGGGGGGLTADGSNGIGNTGGAGGGAEGGAGGDTGVDGEDALAAGGGGGGAGEQRNGGAGGFGGGGGGGGDDASGGDGGAGGQGGFGGGGGGAGADGDASADANGGNGGYFGGGGGAEDDTNAVAGDGGDFGGGGGGEDSDAGNGGFGGGGGGVVTDGGVGDGNGGNGGFGGGGGQSEAGTPGAGGFGAGDGGTSGGGGGAAFGGAVFVRDGGTLIVRGAGTMGGGSVTAGAGAGDGTSGTAAGTGIFLQNATVNFDPGAGETQTINDSIADDTGNGGNSGSLVKSGDGTTTLNAANTYTGDTTVTGGLLDVNGSITSNTIVNSGRLGGSGTVGGLSANAGGTVAPGNSIGTLNVAGDANFAAGTTYQVEVAANGTSDLLNVTGTTTINGGTVDVITVDPETSYVDGTRYTIINSAGGVTGQFSALSTDLNSPFLDLELLYDSTRVFLDLNVVPFDTAALTFNQTQVAGALQDLGQSGDALALFNALLVLNVDEARAAFDLLSGEVHASAVHTFLNTTRHLTGLAGERLWGLDNGLNGGSFKGRGMAMMGLGLSAEALHGRMSLGGSLKDAEPSPQPRGRLAGWARGYGDFAQIDEDGNAAELDSRSGGIMGGVDAPVVPGVRVGLMGHWGTVDGDVDARLSSFDVDTASIAAYAGLAYGAFYFKALAGFSNHDIETERGIVFPGVSRTAAASYDADQLSLYGEAAYRILLAQLAIMPTVALRWSDVDVGRFAEEGAGAANLLSRGDSYDTLDTILGVRLASSFESDGIVFVPQARIGWIHTTGDLTPLMPLTLAGGGAFTVAGVTRAEDALALGVGLNVSVDESLSGFIDYAANLSDESEAHAVSGGFRIRF